MDDLKTTSHDDAQASAETKEQRESAERQKKGALYEGVVEEIVERWAVGKPVNQSPGSTSTKPSGYYRMRAYLLDYLLLHGTFPEGVHSMPEGRDRFNQLEPSFPVDFDAVTTESRLPG